MDLELDGRIVLITGAGGGIGRDAALAFAREGCRIVASDIAVDKAGETAAAVRDLGGKAIGVGVDVSDAESVERLMASAVAEFGGIDVAVNNAGIGALGHLLADLPESEFDRMIGINLKGVWLCMKGEIPLMLQRGGGAIINTASALGLIGTTNACAYVAAKHGVVGLTKAAAIEYSAQKIRVNAICPGIIRTQMTAQATGDDDIGDKYRALLPIGHFGEPRNVTDAMLWLASPRAGFVTGSATVVDGGWTAH